MKKSVVIITLSVILIFILLYIFISKNTLVVSGTQQATVTHAVQNNIHLQASEFLTRIREPNMTTIDIRTKEEYDSGHIDGAINIDFYSSDFTVQLGKLEKEKAYSIYCRSGARSGRALEIMKGLGFTNVVDLQGGYSSL